MMLFKLLIMHCCNTCQTSTYTFMDIAFNEIEASKYVYIGKVILLKFYVFIFIASVNINTYS